MNNVILCGRLTKAPVVSATTSGMQVAKYSLAVDRKGKDKGTDFINCVCFDKTAEFAEKYLSQGMKILVRGHIQTGSYDGKNGKVYTTDIIIDEHEFVEKKESEQAPVTSNDGFMTIPDGVEDSGLPFN